MARVTLVLIADRGTAPTEDEIRRATDALEKGGHAVEVLVPFAPGQNPPAWASSDGPAPAGRWTEAGFRGRVAAAVHGLLEGAGEWLVVAAPHDGHRPEDYARVVEALERSGAALVVASRRADGDGVPPASRLSARLGRGLRRLLGTSDPFSTLVGISRPALESASSEFRAIGSHFTPELLARVPGPRLDLPARPRRRRLPVRPTFDDIRHLKRLADDRFGTASRLLQFCLVGASGMVIDLSAYALFQWLFARSTLAGKVAPLVGSADLAAAAFLAVGLALCWNFSLNRRLTFNDARRGPLVRQFLAYAMSNALAVSLNLTLRLGLPRYVAFFDHHKLAAAVVGVVLATGLSFSLSRWVVFRHAHRARPRPRHLREAPVSEASSAG